MTTWRGIAFAFCLQVLCSASAAMASNPLSGQVADLRMLAFAVVLYEEEMQRWPITDREGTWFDKLAAAGKTSRTVMGSLTVSGGAPVDMYGRPLVYEPPAPATGNRIVIRSVGKNGIDDQGTVDDWEFWVDPADGGSGGEPNLGYWYKRRWPAARRRAEVCAVLAILGVAAAVWWGRRRLLLACSLSLIWLGVLGTIILPWGFDRGMFGAATTASVDPPWLDHVGLVLQR